MKGNRSAFDVELIKRTATWAERIVKKDAEWMDYAGIGPYGQELAALDVALKYIVEDPTLRMFMKLRRAHIMQLRKAHFAGVLANQITMLAFLKGATGGDMDVRPWDKTRKHNNKTDK